jgi:hypothetical protein
MDRPGIKLLPHQLNLHFVLCLAVSLLLSHVHLPSHLRGQIQHLQFQMASLEFMFTYGVLVVDLVPLVVSLGWERMLKVLSL